jgi:hypothetical protein
MALFTIYCDDSGTHQQSRVATVAGYISNVGQWDLFAKEWVAVLNEFNVERMHRADLESFGGDFRRSKGWNERRRTAFVKKLHPIMMRRTHVTIASAVIRNEFEDAVPEPIKEIFGGVYGWCMHECIVQARKWAEKCQRQHVVGSFEWVLEGGTIGYGQVMKMFESLRNTRRPLNEWRIKSWSFQGKDTVPLQAADVIAYETNKHVEHQLLDDGQHREIRMSFLDLYRESDENYMKWWHRERLVDWVNTATWNGKPLREYK